MKSLACALFVCLVSLLSMGCDDKKDGGSQNSTSEPPKKTFTVAEVKEQMPAEWTACNSDADCGGHAVVAACHGRGIIPINKKFAQKAQDAYPSPKKEDYPTACTKGPESLERAVSVCQENTCGFKYERIQ